MYIISKQLDDNKQTDTLQALLGSPSPQFAWKLSSAVVVQLCSFAFTFPSILIKSSTWLHHSNMANQNGQPGSSLLDGQSAKMSRLDEPMEQLDEHLMKHALKEVKYRPGAKFMVFNDIAFQREFLEVHNKVRARHGCPPLSWSQRLADEATAWADKLLAKGRILYRDEQDIGENILLTTIKRSTRLPTGTEVTEKWASQVEKYDFKNPGWSEGSHNFTQMIWKASTEVGCARRWSASSQQTAVVAFYYPVGNANSTQSFRDNVPPPICQ